MNKTELIDHIAQNADLSKAAAGRALDALIGGVRTTLKKGGTVTLVGFGTFAVGKRTARTGRNPRTGAAIKIKAAKVLDTGCFKIHPQWGGKRGAPVTVRAAKNRGAGA
jgi:DNA-binding protein HU-beta